MNGLIAGLFVAIPLILLVGLSVIWPTIRSSLPNVSPGLIAILTFGREELLDGSLMLLAVTAILGVLGSLFRLFPQNAQNALRTGAMITIVVGLLSEVLSLTIQGFPPPDMGAITDVLGTIFGDFISRDLINVFFGATGINPAIAVVIFISATVITAWWDEVGRREVRSRQAVLNPDQSKRQRTFLLASLVLLIVILPIIGGRYLSEVLDQVGLFVLMGLGLNIVVGFAGLLDLGYVAFFAIGAYVMGLLTSTGELGVAGWSFWAALPFCVLAATVAGIILGVPVLRMRGDYLAIVTLGFGEIIRVLVQSDLLKEVIGGAQGILQIGRPQLFDFVFVKPQEFYFLIIIGCLLAVFVSWRLRDARVGRSWMALREDEDVAEAMGIGLVSTKLLAFAVGAAFSGLAGGLFASRISSIFPNSFQLLISINVLSLIIVGGIGSLPGVVVGALFLVGLPELLREFKEYRLLMYGALLISMMLLRPEGLWPSPVRRRELHAGEEEAEQMEPQPITDSTQTV